MNGGEKVKQLREEINKLVAERDYAIRWASKTVEDVTADKNAEIEHLKLEMDGVDNAKEEIGRLLGLTEDFRWKRISAAIHEQKRLIRELVAVLAYYADQDEQARDALTKAKAAGFEP
jgi:hypothetical protein